MTQSVLAARADKITVEIERKARSCSFAASHFMPNFECKEDAILGLRAIREDDRQSRSTETANTYPTPRSVWMTRGALGSPSSLRRRRRICTSMLRSKTSS